MARDAEFLGAWVHFIETVYGAWLHGDVRGFRTRHHCEHIEGEHKNPPPVEKYADERRRSIESLKQPPVGLASSATAIADTPARAPLASSSPGRSRSSPA
jgi:hypothetical protein